MHSYNKVWDEQVHGEVVDGNEVLVDGKAVEVEEAHDVGVEVVGAHDDEGGNEVQVGEPQSEDEVHGAEEVEVEVHDNEELVDDVKVEVVHDAAVDGKVEAVVVVHDEQEGGNVVLGVVEEVVCDVVEVVLRGKVGVLDDNVDAREVEGDDTQAWVEVVGVGFHS